MYFHQCYPDFSILSNVFNCGVKMLVTQKENGDTSLFLWYAERVDPNY